MWKRTKTRGRSLSLSARTRALRGARPGCAEVRQDWAETAAPEAAAAEEGRREAEAPMDAAPEAGEEAVAATAREGSGGGRRSWRSRTEGTGTEEQEVAMPTLVFGLTRSNPN